MMTILIGAILGILISIGVTYNDREEFIMYILNAGTGVLYGAAFSVFIALALPVSTTTKQDYHNIETLQDNNSVSGGFFLGCGQIEGKMKYVFYYEEKGLYRMCQLDYDNVQIRYSEGTPRVITTTKVATDAFINNFALDWYFGDESYIIEVPKGTIKNNYNLDAQ